MHSSRDASLGRDLLHEMVDAFRAEGIKVGFYYSLLDWHHPEFPVDKLHPQRDETTWKSVAQVLGMLIDGVSKGGNMLMNIGPTGRGEIDYRAQAALEGLGAWMRVNSRSIHSCGAAPAGMRGT